MYILCIYRYLEDNKIKVIPPAIYNLSQLKTL